MKVFNKTTLSLFKAQASILLYLAAADIQSEAIVNLRTPLTKLLKSKIKRTVLLNDIARLHGAESWSELNVHASDKATTANSNLRNSIEDMAALRGVDTLSHIKDLLSPESAEFLITYLPQLPPASKLKNSETTFLTLVGWVNNGLVARQVYDQYDNPEGYELMDLDSYVAPDCSGVATLISGASTYLELVELVKDNFNNILTLYMVDTEGCMDDPIVKQAYRMG